MKKSLKTMAVLISAAIMAVTPITAKAESWKSDTIGWWVENDDGSYLVNQWYLDSASGLYYYMGSDGYMLTNAATPDGYYVDANGVWIQGVTVDGAQQTAGGQVQSSGGLQQIYGALANEDTRIFEDAVTDIEEFAEANWSVLRTYTVEQRINVWAQHSALGAAWKDVMDRYNSYGIITGALPVPAYSDDAEGAMIEMSCYLVDMLMNL